MFTKCLTCYCLVTIHVIPSIYQTDKKLKTTSMKKTSHILPESIQADINESNEYLLSVLELLTPLDRKRTGNEQVMFELALMATKKLPANNIFQLAKYN